MSEVFGIDPDEDHKALFQCGNIDDDGVRCPTTADRAPLVVTAYQGKMVVLCAYHLDARSFRPDGDYLR